MVARRDKCASRAKLDSCLIIFVSSLPTIASHRQWQRVRTALLHDVDCIEVCDVGKNVVENDLVCRTIAHCACCALATGIKSRKGSRHLMTIIPFYRRSLSRRQNGCLRAFDAPSPCDHRTKAHAQSMSTALLPRAAPWR